MTTENSSQKKDNTRRTTIALLATLMSFVALAIDSMLPALDQIGTDLNFASANDTQFIISSVFLGMGLGLLFFGPFSDAYGRKLAIFIGIGIFIVGCGLSFCAETFQGMIAGRLLQGAGGASCRVVTVAMIRDRFAGKAMAKVMSLIMIVFILIPSLAPSLGQIVLEFSSWRMIFLGMAILGAITTVWLYFGIEETLPSEKRRSFSPSVILSGIQETLSNRISLGYTLASGLIFGAFVGYLSSSQQILQLQYDTGPWFSVVFGLLALSIGLSSFANSKWVDRYSMETLCLRALYGLLCISGVAFPITLYFNGNAPFPFLILQLSSTFFCFGILFGNFNALAIQPLGHIAGIANSVMSATQTLLSVGIGGGIGYLYDGSTIPMAGGFLMMSGLSLLIVRKLLAESTDRTPGQ